MASVGRHPTGQKSESTAGRRALSKLGLALPDGSFPVGDADHWDKARKAIGRVKNPAKRQQVAQLLRRTAARYGRTQQLRESWAAPQKAAVAAANHPLALEFTVPGPRLAVASPYDVIISRADDGSAVLRHRRGGYEIARIRRDPDGAWVSSIDGRDLQPHVRQRAALLEAIGVHNKGSTTLQRRAETTVVRGEELQPPPVQTQLMESLGIPAVRMSLANSAPVVGASDGPRASSKPPGLGARGQTIYKKLRGRGFPHARAHAFAGRAERFAARRGGK